MNTPTFEKLMEVVRGGRKISGGTIPESEFCNETWMLRLTLALLAEFKGEPSKTACRTAGAEMAFAAMNDVRAALKVGWISEGGLAPVFEKERTTWTDAILGDVRLSADKRRAVEGNANGGYGGAIVIEAKIGSALSPRVTHDKHYDQAARNIACLARFVQEHGISPGRTRFLVFAPESRIAHPAALIAAADKTIQNATRSTRIDMDKLKGTIGIIREHSGVISWKYVLSYMRGHVEGRRLEALEGYYSDVKDRSGVKI